ncbi:Intron-binding protein aquarius [Sphaceloma murrayae]|uniref:Intron-binding protein aquarius n=1 Tax=Sphaceloma murrayae TaxID=2082308 RepID=A0A2K1QLG1_9PEZI|nr:Intron-binding protein aquarius [Sphaceloma murrayae]
MFVTLIRRFHNSPRPLIDALSNPYKAKRPWPPDFASLSQKHQFQLERRYRRRAKLKWARPGWVRFTKIAQWGTIGFVLVYSVLFLNWGGNAVAFDQIREWYAGLGKDVWTKRQGDAVDTADPKATSAR